MNRLTLRFFATLRERARTAEMSREFPEGITIGEIWAGLGSEIPALAAHREAEYENYRKGFELIYKQLLDNITKLGVERIDPLGKPFDPHLHQAMDRTETTEHADGVILQTFQPGYVFHGRVLRPAMVRVAVHPSPASKQAVN